METQTEQINGPDPPTSPHPSDHDLLRSELDSLRHSHRSLLSKSAEMEEDLNHLQSQHAASEARTAELTRAVGEVSGERDALREELHNLERVSREKEEERVMKTDEEVKKKETVEIEVRIGKEKIEILEKERKQRDEFIMKCVDSLRPIKKELSGMIEGLDDEELHKDGGGAVEDSEHESGLLLQVPAEWRAIWEEITAIKRLVGSAEARVEEYKDLRHKERRQLGNSVVSLTEENRDISTLLRIALVEKEAVEKRLKGSGEAKRVAILQRVGFSPFGFLMGSGGNEEGSVAAKLEGMGSGASCKSDSSECEEEVVSLVSCSTFIFSGALLVVS